VCVLPVPGGPSKRIPRRLVAELLVIQEDIESVPHFGQDRAQTLDIGEGDIDLLGEKDDFGRASVSQHRANQDDTQQKDDENAGEPVDGFGRQLRPTRRNRVTAQDSHPQPGDERRHDPCEPAEPAAALEFPRDLHVYRHLCPSTFQLHGNPRTRRVVTSYGKRLREGQLWRQAASHGPHQLACSES